jgi:hypothetical protein
MYSQKRQSTDGYRDADRVVLASPLSLRSEYSGPLASGSSWAPVLQAPRLPADEYRPPTDAEWTEFEDHFDKRKVELGTCGRPYGTPCQHEFASDAPSCR